SFSVTAPGTSCTGGTPSNLPALRFHSVHWKNVRVSRDGFSARNLEPYGARKGVVCIRFVEVSNSWGGFIRFGFTSHDPASLAHSLHEFTGLELRNEPDNWAWVLSNLNEQFCEKDSILYYYVNSAGYVHYGINGEEKALLVSLVDTTNPLWAFVNIYGNIRAIQFVDDGDDDDDYDDDDDDADDDDDDDDADSIAPSQARRANHSPVEDERLVRSMTSLSVEDSSSLVPLSLHRTKGINVQYANDRGEAARSENEFCQGYVFTARPMRPGQTIVVRVLETEAAYAGSLAIGLTSCDPAMLQPCDLPDDAEWLLDRPEYWVVRRDAATGLRRGDELAVTLTLDGEVRISRNGSNPVTDMHVDHTVRLWAFVDIYGATQKVMMLSSQLTQTPPQQLRVIAESAPLSAGAGGTELAFTNSRPPSSTRRDTNQPEASIHNEHAQTTNGHDLRVERASSVIGEGDMTGTECIICCENPIDSVLYMCGHMCMCYTCAEQQWKVKGD
ncbi:putative neuralized, partial [Operophtera brumata]